MKPDYLFTSQKAFLAESIRCSKYRAKSLYPIWDWLQSDQTAGICPVSEYSSIYTIAPCILYHYSAVKTKMNQGNHHLIFVQMCGLSGLQEESCISLNKNIIKMLQKCETHVL